MNYTLYHDESKYDGFWHGILLVPNEKKSRFLELINTVRYNTKYFSEIGIKNVKEKKSRAIECAAGLIEVGVAGLISQSKGKRHPIDLKKQIKGKKEYDLIIPDIGAKFILFREKDNKTRIDYYPDYGSIIETTFRFGLKGGVHYLGNVNNDINITKMHFDGHKHYGREIDKDRIIGRLYGLRDYFKIEDDPNIIDDRPSNHKKHDCQNYVDCQFLQLTDLLIGAFRSNLGSATKPLHKKIGYPTKQLIDRYFEGYYRMKNSRWADSFCFSQCQLTENGWIFEEIKIEDNNKEKQLHLDL
jgi:hypothetical protein